MIANLRLPAAVLTACSVMLTIMPAAGFGKSHKSLSAAPPAHILYVDGSAAAGGNGSSWAQAFTKLQDALRAASASTGIDSILVAKGTYRPTDNGNRDSTFIVGRGYLALVGGYPAKGGVRNFKINRTILSGDIGAPGDSTDNSNHVLVIAGLPYNSGPLAVNGFFIVGGNANQYSETSVGGQGIYRGYAGGVYLQYNNNSSITFANCVFGNHTSSAGGGAIYQETSYVTYQNCAFFSNYTVSVGGGIFVNSIGLATLNSCVFYDNSANSAGGAVYGLNNGNIFLSGCTLVKNSSNTDGAACTINAYETITNSIFWKNRGRSYRNICPNALVHYSLIEGGYPDSDSVLDADPLFVAINNPLGADRIPFTADDGLNLRANSPAIDAGDNSWIGNSGNLTDITGAMRIVNGIVDMGAYEYKGTRPVAASNNRTVTQLPVIMPVAEATIRVYPNPASQTAYLYTNGLHGSFSVTVTDISGKVMQQVAGVKDARLALPLSSLASGTYLVTVRSEAFTKTLKLVKK